MFEEITARNGLTLEDLAEQVNSFRSEAEAQRLENARLAERLAQLEGREQSRPHATRLSHNRADGQLLETAGPAGHKDAEPIAALPRRHLLKRLVGMGAAG